MHCAIHSYAYAYRFTITSVNLIYSRSKTLKPSYQRETWKRIYQFIPFYQFYFKRKPNGHCDYTILDLE